MPLVALLLVALLASPLAAQSPPAPSKTARAAASRAIEPGTYDLSIVFGGGTMDATLVLTPQGDSLAAKLSLGNHESPIKTVVQRGARLSLAGGGDGVQVTYELTFTGATLTGTFTYNGDAGTLTGTRRK